MINTVHLVEELVEFSRGLRSTVAVCATKELAEAWVEQAGGNQMVLLDSGEPEAIYRISTFIVEV